ncbi:MAG: hypothetical protein ACI4VR_03695, partial [Bacilli bacterium]
MKKKAYLYLGLLGVGLMLGGLSALISKNVSETLAYELDCYDSTSTYGCPSGSTEIGNYCTTDGIDANSSSTCKGKGGTWIDDECYQTVDKIVKYSCPNGGELSSDKTQCCIKTQCAHYTKASCESAYSDITRSCTCTKDSDGCWKKDSCTSIAPTSCNDYTSSTMRNNCSNCDESGGSWNFNNDSCSCPNGYILGNDGICEANGNMTCGDYTSESGWRDDCSNCQESGGSWGFTSHSCSCPNGYILGNDGICEA